jgi:hypothetical protein
MALTTVQDFVDQVRTLLQDQVVPYRYTDAELVTNLNDAVFEARRIRPDLFLKTFSSLPSYDTSGMSDEVDIDQMYRMSVVYYMTGLAQLRDQEDTQDQRATIFLNKFISQLTGVQA